MGTTNKMVNRAKSWITTVKNRIITQDIVPPKVDVTKYEGSKIRYAAKSPWWVVLYSSKTRPKLTRMQPLKTFGNFSPHKEFNFVRGSATPRTAYHQSSTAYSAEPEGIPE